MNYRDQYSIRRFDISDIGGITKLLSTCFRKEFTSDWWKWKYELNPNGFFGEKGDIWIAEKNNEIIGHYALIPEKIEFYSKTVISAQSVDTATDPNFRGMGVFRNLSKQVYADTRNRYAFLFGFPSKMSYTGFIKIGWKSYPFVQYNKILDFDRFCESRIKSGSAKASAKLFLRILSKLNSTSIIPLEKNKGKDTEIREVDTFPDEINRFWKLARTGHRIVLQRSASFLNWRFSKYFGCYRLFLCYSKQDNEILGYMVIREVDSALEIIDLITLPGEEKVASQLTGLATKIGAELKAECLRCHFPKWYDASFLRKLGFFSTNNLSKMMGEYATPFIFYSERGDVPVAHAWFYTLADTDYA